MAYIGYARHRSASVVLTHGSIATAAVALARAENPQSAILIMLMETGLSYTDTHPIKLNEHRLPLFPDRGGLGILADLEADCLSFYAPVGWSTDWGCVGSLETGFRLDDVEAVEATLALAFRPTAARKLRAAT